MSLAIGQWNTGLVLIALTVFNAVYRTASGGQGGERDECAEGPHEADRPRAPRRSNPRSQPRRSCLGDLVLLAAGDNVAADGRRYSAGSLDIDESALTGESVPASKTTEALTDADLGPGDQTNMAFMNTPVTHGSGMMIVTARGAEAEVGKIAGMLAATTKKRGC